MPAICEYASVTVRRCSPRSARVDGKVTAKLMGLSYQILGGSGSDPSTADDPSLQVTCTEAGGFKAFVADLRSFDLIGENGLRRACEQSCPTHVRAAAEQTLSSRYRTRASTCQYRVPLNAEVHRPAARRRLQSATAAMATIGARLLLRWIRDEFAELGHHFVE
jgi:hypothetical protein